MFVDSVLNHDLIIYHIALLFNIFVSNNILLFNYRYYLSRPFYRETINGNFLNKNGVFIFRPKKKNGVFIQRGEHVYPSRGLSPYNSGVFSLLYAFFIVLEHLTLKSFANYKLILDFYMFFRFNPFHASVDKRSWTFLFYYMNNWIKIHLLYIIFLSYRQIKGFVV